MEGRVKHNAVHFTSARIVMLALCFALPATADEPEHVPKPFTAAQLHLYETEVKPILTQHCVNCHGAGPKIRGGFRLDSREALLRGGDLGPAATPGDPSTSLLVKAINYIELEMPPAGKLPAREIEILTRWVKQGLPWVPNPAAPSGAPSSETKDRTPSINPAKPKPRDNDWSLRPVSRPAVPPVKHDAWCRTPIDAFILAKLEAEGLEPAPPADRTTLIRRLTYDLIGLPPSPAEVDAFIADESPGAVDRLTDRLLASPHYGEKWGRHWLDLVRYGETNGYERDSEKPFAWRYRDYVISSLNQDKPYDQFVREQVAGDEISPGAAEPLIATGFYRLGIWDDEPADRQLARYDGLDGVIATTAQVFLGMSINCARCHDHKVDPIPQRDYYRLLAVFHNVTHSDGKDLKKVKPDGGPPIEVMSVAERGRADTHILLRGNPSLHGDSVEPGVPQILGGLSFASEESRSRRQALARWLTDARNPRTARVMANRIWQYHFGRGIVPTPNEFGGLGEPASLPELLDWLAVELVDGGWRLKRLHRMIVLSSAYRMSSRGTQSELARDPSNRWLWRFPMRRLAAEEVRDSILSVAGTLNLKAGGPPVHPPIPREVMAGQSVPGQGWLVSPAAEAARRSVFVHVKRSLLVPILATHDAADTDLSCPVRYTTTVPTQALGFLNGAFANEQAARFAERLTREASVGIESQVRLALTLTTARKPDDHEVAQDVAFVKRIESEAGLDPARALAQYCLLILNTNAFLYLD
jgi:mono/diheme cytochrome c family protein